jgi:hypothetical protein
MAAINTHQAKDGTKTYRVRVRRKGEPTQTASFPSLKHARKWATMVEGDRLLGDISPQGNPSIHSLDHWKGMYRK